MLFTVNFHCRACIDRVADEADDNVGKICLQFNALPFGWFTGFFHVDRVFANEVELPGMMSFCMFPGLHRGKGLVLVCVSKKHGTATIVCRKGQ